MLISFYKKSWTDIFYQIGFKTSIKLRFSYVINS
jgi:hypothetical protein